VGVGAGLGVGVGVGVVPPVRAPTVSESIFGPFVPVVERRTTFWPAARFAFQAKVFHDRDQPEKVAYVVIYSGSSLDPFLTKFSST